MKISLLTLSSIFDDVIKRSKITPKWPLLALAFSLPQHVLLGFRFQNNKLWMDGKQVDQGVLGRKYLRNLAFGFPRMPAQSMERG